MKKTTINLRARPIALVLAGIATFLAVQSIALRAIQYRLGDTNSYWLYQYGELANINREANIPTWFSASILLVLALLLFLTTLHRRSNGQPWLGWAGLTAIFTYISMDETGTIHEKLTPILQEQLELTGYFYFGWVVVGLAAVLVVGLVYLPFVKRLPPRIRNLFILAAVLYVGGALVVESISANLWFHNDGTSLQFSAVGTLEEWMEMLGVITMIYAQLEYIRTEIGAVQLNVVSTAAEAGVKAGTAAAPLVDPGD